MIIAMAEETGSLRRELIHAIAGREGNARELADRFDMTTNAIRQFTQVHLEAIKAEKERIDNPPQDSQPSPEDLASLWITNKLERLKRLQKIAEDSYEMLTQGPGMTPAEYATAMRELRSYMMLAANELGQLMHRGSGDAGEGQGLSIEIAGVDMDSLR